MRKERLPFMFFAMISLVAGLLAGLRKMGWDVPAGILVSNHGAIMVGGFLGTQISLEKVIPLKNNFLLVVPALSAGSVFSFFLEHPMISLVLLNLASIGLSVVFFVYLLRERSVVYAIMFIGGLCWLTGNVLLATDGFYPVTLPWWMAFVLCVITSERLELMKFLPVRANKKLVFFLGLWAFLVSCLMSFHGPGKMIGGVSLIVISGWLMLHDVVGISVKKEGLVRFVGIALLAGYFSLMISGVLAIVLSSQPLGYDMLVHCFFVGFVFSMIFAHGPIILPGVLGISIKPFHPLFYFWLTLLQGSWLLRATADVALNMQIRMYSGLMSGVAILGYFISLAVVSIRCYRGKAF